MAILAASRTWMVLVAVFHVIALVLEVFLPGLVFSRVTGLELSSVEPELSKVIARLLDNQGVYNGFLAAGLLLTHRGGAEMRAAQTFLLVCVVIAGLVGIATFGGAAFFVQAGLPVVALALLWFGPPTPEQ